MACSVTAATSGLAAGVGGEQLDDLVLDEGGVDVHDDQAPSAAGEAGGRARDVDSSAAATRARSRRRTSRSAPETSNSMVVTG